jgi:hypothetical protein
LTRRKGSFANLTTFVPGWPFGRDLSAVALAGAVLAGAAVARVAKANKKPRRNPGSGARVAKGASTAKLFSFAHAKARPHAPPLPSLTHMLALEFEAGIKTIDGTAEETKP